MPATPDWESESTRSVEEGVSTALPETHLTQRHSAGNMLLITEAYRNNYR